MSVCLRCKRYERKSFLVCPACEKELTGIAKECRERQKREPKTWIPLERWTK